MRDWQVLIIDDHPIVRSGLAQYINQQAGFHVCGEAGDGQEALKKARECNPDMIVLDISLGNANGLTLIPDLKMILGDVPILVLSMHDEFLYAERALRAGANGYIMKDAATEEVIAAMRRILDDGIYLSQEMSRRLLGRLLQNDSPAESSCVNALTNRELQIFEMIGGGRKSGEIATDLRISTKTVEAHRANIKKKLKLRNHIELLQYATQWVQSPYA